MSSSITRARGEAHSRAPNGEAEALFARHGARLQVVVDRRVDTSRANVEDACAFAWLQLCRYRPDGERVVGWLLRTAVREALRLHRLPGALELDAFEAHSGDLHASPVDARLEFIAAGETIAAAGLSEREAQLVALRSLGYTYRESAELSGQSRRTVTTESNLSAFAR